MPATGLDLHRNVSFFTVPVAFLICLVPHFIAVFSAGHGIYDNSSPRDFKDSVGKNSSITAQTKRRILRAEAATNNGFETLGFFAGAVVAANQAGLDTATLNALSIGYILSRIVFVFLYIMVQNRGLSWLRTFTWDVGVALSTTLWVKARLRL
ncbi:membrane protein [Thelonectria olida]|uniref:Membrane protein n=1 Tax=Thelonectria olida TaxID=1576542 RepID=A0A9P8VPB4_9HYPO|nr:membrane protein [Thelonectria olida]